MTAEAFSEETREAKEEPLLVVLVLEVETPVPGRPVEVDEEIDGTVELVEVFGLDLPVPFMM